MVGRLCQTALGPRLVCGSNYDSGQFTNEAMAFNPHATIACATPASLFSITFSCFCVAADEDITAANGHLDVFIDVDNLYQLDTAVVRAGLIAFIVPVLAAT